MLSPSSLNELFLWCILPQVPLLEAGDIIIDGGNSEYRDTTVSQIHCSAVKLHFCLRTFSLCVCVSVLQRRCKSLKEKGLLFVGSGVSGGEEGARYGPSLMPGGHKEAWWVPTNSTPQAFSGVLGVRGTDIWTHLLIKTGLICVQKMLFRHHVMIINLFAVTLRPHIKDIFQSIAAKVGTGEPCCDWVSAIMITTVFINKSYVKSSQKYSPPLLCRLEMRVQDILLKWSIMVLSMETCSWSVRLITWWRMFWEWTTMRWHRWAVTQSHEVFVTLLYKQRRCWLTVFCPAVVETLRLLTAGTRQSWTPFWLKSQPTSSNTETRMVHICCPRSVTVQDRKAQGSGRLFQLWSTARLLHWSVRQRKKL